MRQYITHLGYQSNFGIGDDGDRQDIIKEIIQNRHLKDSDLKLDYFASGISNAKNDLKEPNLISFLKVTFCFS